MLLILQIVPILMTIYFIFRFIFLDKKLRVSMPLYMYFAIYPYFNLNTSVGFYSKVTYVFALGILIVFLIKLLNKNRKADLDMGGIILYLLLFLILIIISIYNVSDFSLYQIGIRNYIYSFVLLISVTSLIKGKLGIILNLFKLNAIIISFVTILESLLFNVHRPAAFLGNTNFLAMYLIIGLTVSFYIGSTGKFRRFFEVLFILIAISLTESDAVIIGVLILFVPKMYFNLSKYIFPIVISCIFLVINANIDNVYFLVKLFENNTDRLGIWMLAFFSMEDNYILGIGYNDFVSSFTHYLYNLPIIDKNFAYLFSEDIIYMATHNDFLKILVELGVLGLLVLFLIIYISLKRVENIEQKSMKGLAYTLVCTTVVFMFTHNYFPSFESLFLLSIPYLLYKDQIDYLKLKS